MRRAVGLLYAGKMKLIYEDREKQRERMVFRAVCFTDFSSFVKAAREIVIPKSIMVSKNQSSF